MENLAPNVKSQDGSAVATLALVREETGKSMELSGHPESVSSRFTSQKKEEVEEEESGPSI